MIPLEEEIRQLKKEKNAVILAHYYVPDCVQAIADEVGDSFYLAKKAKDSKASLIVFAGVSFMGESACMLNPDKKVCMPDLTADCAMAHMASEEKIKHMRDMYDDLAVVCYINSTAALKMLSDVCVTSSNAVGIVRALPNQHIYFIPDGNLGAFVKAQVPEKDIILNDGFCPVHQQMTIQDVTAAKAEHPGAQLLVHPECPAEVADAADFVGSTAEIIEFAGKSEAESFIIGTEDGVLHELNKRNPNKHFYLLKKMQQCADMKKVTLEKVRDCLKYESGQITVPSAVCRLAVKPLEKMLEMAK